MAARTVRTRILLGASALALVGAIGTLVAALWLAGGVVAGYTAKVVCSCVFVSSRPDSACLAEDAGDLSGFVRAAVDREARAVTARPPLGRTARAALKPGGGCTLE